jgi:hypothetical protein
MHQNMSEHSGMWHHWRTDLTTAITALCKQAIMCMMLDVIMQAKEAKVVKSKA